MHVYYSGNIFRDFLGIPKQFDSEFGKVKMCFFQYLYPGKSI